MLNRTARLMLILKLQRLGLLPREVLVREVTVLCGLEVDRLSKVELFYNDARPHVEVRPDDFDQFL